MHRGRRWSATGDLVHDARRIVALAGREQLGASRRAALATHLGWYTTLYPDGRTCVIWGEIVDHCRRDGKPIHTADAWIASTALQWRIPLVTADFRDYEVIDDLELVPIR